MGPDRNRSPGPPPKKDLHISEAPTSVKTRVIELPTAVTAATIAMPVARATRPLTDGFRRHVLVATGLRGVTNEP